MSRDGNAFLGRGLQVGVLLQQRTPSGEELQLHAQAMVQGWNMDRCERQDEELNSDSTEGSYCPLLNWRVMTLRRLVYSLLTLTNIVLSFDSKECTQHKTTGEL